MADYSFTYLADGASLTGAQATAYFDGPKTPINAIDVEQLKRGSFGRPHISPLYRGGGSDIRDLDTFQVNGDHGLHTYDRATFGNSLKYRSATDFQADDGTDTAINLGTSRWSMVGHPSAGGAYVGAGGPTMKLTWSTGVKLDNQASYYVGGILIGFNCEVVRLESPGAVTEHVGFTIQYQASDGVKASAWYTIPRSTRFVSLDDAVLSGSTPFNGDPMIDVPIRTLLKVDDLVDHAGLLSTATVTGIRAMVTMVDNAADAAILTLARCNLSAVPLHARVS